MGMRMRVRIGGGESCCDRLSDEREREREERGSVGSPFKRGYVCLHAESIFPDACICIEAEAASEWDTAFLGGVLWVKSEILPFYLSYPPKL